MQSRRVLACLLLLAASNGAAAQSRRLSFRASGIAVEVTFANDSLARLGPQLQRTLTGGVARYQTLFAGPPKNPDGSAATRLRVSVRPDAFGGGDSDPGVIQLLVAPRPVFGFYEWRFTLLHELFHLWAAESFRYATQREQWFNEGAAEFYALQTAAQLGIIDAVTAIRIAATAVGFYQSAGDRPMISIADAGSRKAEEYFLVYEGGWAALLLLDRNIRAQTRGTNSLDDLMHWMYASFDRGHPYTNADIARGLELATGMNFQAWFDRHITGTQPLPVQTLNLGENLRLIYARVAGARDIPAPDAVLLQSLGLAPPDDRPD